MRGIETGKARIRHDVFTEIARMAYEGGDYAKRLEELPFKIIPGEIGAGTMRPIQQSCQAVEAYSDEAEYACANHTPYLEYLPLIEEKDKIRKL